MDPISPQCPVCRARFRRSRVCARCGADLGPLMVLCARAHRLREEAREALGLAEFRRALEQAAQAERLHSTPAGRRLSLVAAWLAR